MKKYRSELLYLPFYHEGTLLGLNREIIINPDNGQVIGYATEKDLSQYIPFSEALYFLDRFFCQERDPITDSEDVIKTKAILDENKQIFNKPVFTLAGEKIGIISDFQIEMNFGQLTQISVNKFKFLFLYFGSTRLISHLKIHAIESDRVIVKNNFETKKANSSRKIKTKKAEPIVMSPALNCDTE